MWSQVLETSATADVYGTAPPSGDPVCFVRADSNKAAVAYMSQDGVSVLQPFTFHDGTWMIDYGDAHFILQAN
jgi:hypothetical protein